MAANGASHKVWGREHDAREAFVSVLKKHVSMSIEFTLLALNVVHGKLFIYILELNGGVFF